ncbi:MAG TPA: AarF/UbiB family protein [Geobacteraceae bacterium]|nr:AarF/UbiB family protein [Geobacteraceae bacterium]
MLGLMRIRLNARSVKRYRQIVGVLIKYGFENLLEYLNLAQFIARGMRLFRHGEPGITRLSPAERMRLAFEELGPTFIKLGQLLSTRPDIIPGNYVVEFAKLQDMVPAFPFGKVRKRIKDELGGEIEDFFSAFDEKPVAAASIAQVHRADLLSGEEVVVKVLRPGVEEAVETDIDVLMGLAVLARRHFRESDIFDPVALVGEFARTIRREMDLSREGHTIEKFMLNFKDDPGLYFPRVYWGQTTKGILTLEYIHGIKVSELEALDLAGLDRKLIAKRGADSFLRQVLTHGYFHGDPHPGNIYILPGNKVCLLDYGMVGRLDSQSKDFLTDFLMAIIDRDVDGVISVLLYSGDITDILDVRGLKRDLSDFIDSYYDVPLQNVVIGRMLVEFIEIMASYRISFRPDFMLLAKALMTIEGMGRQLDPDFNMVEHLRPFVLETVRKRVSAGSVARDVGSHLMSYINLAKNLPDDIKEILNRINRNKFKIDLEHRGLDYVVRELDKSSNRLSSSLIITALIVGSSLIMQSNRGPLLMGFPILAVLGYLVAALLGLWLVIAIFRSGRL